MEGRPQRRCRWSALLAPGLYLATAYGGAPAVWAQQSDALPLAVRWDVPELPASGQRSGEVGPMGFDRYRVPAEADTFYVSLPEVADAQLTVAAGSVRSYAPDPRRTKRLDHPRRADGRK